jgi:hypothetical protein
MDIEDKPVPRILISLFFERGILWECIISPANSSHNFQAKTFLLYSREEYTMFIPENCRGGGGVALLTVKQVVLFRN